MKQIKLEVGKTYRSRKGEEVKIVRKDDYDSKYPYQGSKGEWYTESGRSRYFGKEDPEGLIEEVPSESDCNIPLVMWRFSIVFLIPLTLILMVTVMPMRWLLTGKYKWKQKEFPLLYNWGRKCGL